MAVFVSRIGTTCDPSGFYSAFRTESRSLGRRLCRSPPARPRDVAPRTRWAHLHVARSERAEQPAHESPSPHGLRPAPERAALLSRSLPGAFGCFQNCRTCSVSDGDKRYRRRDRKTRQKNRPIAATQAAANPLRIGRDLRAVRSPRPQAGLPTSPPTAGPDQPLWSFIASRPRQSHHGRQSQQPANNSTVPGAPASVAPYPSSQQAVTHLSMCSSSSLTPSTRPTSSAMGECPCPDAL